MTAILTNAWVEAAGFSVSFKSAADDAYVSVGTVENNDDFALRQLVRTEDYTASFLGDTPVDTVWTGMETTLSLVLNEINAPGALSLVYSVSELGTIGGTASTGCTPGLIGAADEGRIGVLGSYIGGTLQLSPVFTALPTYDDGTDETSIFIDSFFLQDGSEVERLLKAGRHIMPLTFRVFPCLDSSDSDRYKFYRWGAAA